MTRTRTGIVVTAVGHDPDAAQRRGSDPRRVRTYALIACGLLAGLGGAALSLGATGAYAPNIVGGRGLIVIAIVILAGPQSILSDSAAWGWFSLVLVVAATLWAMFFGRGPLERLVGRAAKAMASVPKS